MDPLATAQLDAAAVAAPTEQNAAWALALFHIFQNFTNTVTGNLDGGIAAMIDAQIAWLNPILRAVAFVVIAATAIHVYQGRSLAGMMSLLLRIAIILTILASAASYAQWVQNLANNAPTEIGNMLSGPLGGQFTGAGAFDNAMNADLKAAMICYDNTPLSLKAIFIWMGILVCLAVTAFAILMAFVTWFVSLIALKLLIAIGPICIAFAIWGGGPTAQWTANWLSVTVSAIAAQVLVVAVLVLIGFGEQQTVNNVQQGAGGNPLTELQALFVMALISGIMSIFVGQIPDIAARIFHGLAFRTAPYIAAASAVGGTAAAGAKGAYGAAKAAGTKVGGFVGRSMSG